MSVDLSVLICSTHTRYKTFGVAIQDQIWGQLAALSAEDQARIEVLMLVDNKAMMLGAKRNAMVDMAQGRYVTFVDDDDRLEPSYLADVLTATRSDADVITFQVSVSLNGEAPKICRYSRDYLRDRNTAAGYERLPNHICVVKLELASKVSFPSVPYGEDSAYSKLLHPLLKTEHIIPKVLYHYDYSSETTETQQHLKGKARVRPNQAPIVDVIFLSRADSPQEVRMTRKAIASCIAGANSLPVNIIVMEQGKMPLYPEGTTIRRPRGGFHYNRSANIGAGHGSAPWIMVANNDLVFHDGWLHALLAADHPVVSPKNPGDTRQADITENTCGTRVGRHLSGWCYMLKRELWEKIGGFDESVVFWCSDDVVVEQLKEIGVEPMLVPGATVRHLTSVTLRRSPERDYMTWGQLHVFIEKFGGHRLQDHPEYLRWKANNVAVE